jgi:hypothetical protein
MTVVLTVLSGMDPHTIRVTRIGMVGMLGVGQSRVLGRAATVDSMVCSMSHFKEKSFQIRISHSMQPQLPACQNYSQPFLD